MSDNKEKRPIDLELMCELSDEELQHRAQQLGAAVVEQDEIDSRKKDAMKAFGDEAKEVAQRMRLLSRAIRSRKERRLVGCVIEFHTPTQATKRTTRLDTGEVVSEQAMSSEECQDHLFDTEPEPAAEAQELPLEGVTEQLDQLDADRTQIADTFRSMVETAPGDPEATTVCAVTGLRLKACPKCGSSNVGMTCHDPGDGLPPYWGQCDDCGFSTETDDNVKMAAHMWGMSTGEAKPADETSAPGGEMAAVAELVDETPAAEPAADPETPARKGRRRR